MKDIFSELYNKVLGFFRQTEKKEEETAKDVACNRLKVVLMQDRTNLTPELMNRMRKELVELLSKYVEMDKEALELGFEQEGTQMALMLSIPVVRAKDEAEIEAILAKEDEEKAKREAEKAEAEDNEENAEEITAEDDTEDVSATEDNDSTEETENEITDKSDSEETEEEVNEKETETVTTAKEEKELVTAGTTTSKKKK